MRIEDIEIHTGTPSSPFEMIGPIKAQVGAATVFSRAPTIDDVNSKLRELAAGMGANAVIDVSYDRGVSMTSWKALTAFGSAVVISHVAEVADSASIEGRLSALNVLKAKGLVTEAEYQSKRSAILGEL